MEYPGRVWIKIDDKGRRGGVVGVGLFVGGGGGGGGVGYLRGGVVMGEGFVGVPGLTEYCTAALIRIPESNSYRRPQK